MDLNEYLLSSQVIKVDLDEFLMPNLDFPYLDGISDKKHPKTIREVIQGLNRGSDSSPYSCHYFAVPRLEFGDNGHVEKPTNEKMTTLDAYTRCGDVIQGKSVAQSGWVTESKIFGLEAT